MTPLLEARGAGLRIGHRWLVESASLSIVEGEVLAIIGPNGAGKSTLLKLLSGELLPDAGQILLDGLPMRAFRPWQLAQHRALMAQSGRLGFSFSVAEVVALGLDGLAAGLDQRARDSILATCIRRADVLHLAERDFPTLSGGEQQRVHFARACAQLLAARPRQPRQVLMLDEPVASLDLAHQISLMRNALDLAAMGIAVVAVLHDINLAVTFADRVLVMHQGKIAASGPPRSVVTRDLLRSVFAVDMAIDRLPRGGVPAVLPQNYACAP